MTGIFRADDIRGKFNKDFEIDQYKKICFEINDLTNQEAKKIGFAANKYVKSKTIILGRDNRLSSDTLRDSFVSEIDKEIIDLGRVPTPVFYFALDLHKSLYGFMITASHLPKEFNGFKINKGPICLTYDTGINKIEALTYKYKESKHHPRIKKVNINPVYFKFLKSKIKLHKKLVVAVEGGNGIAGIYLVKALKMLGCKVIPLYCNPDGNYPHHVPNPLVNETLRDFQNLIKKHKVDIGLAVDGDGDRVRMVDPKGKIIENEVMISILAEYFLLKKPKSKIVYSSICSDQVKDIVLKYNGIPIMEKVGHSFMKNRAMKEKAVLWGEYAGHIGFKENNYDDDGIYAGLKLCELLSKYPYFWQEVNQLSGNYLAPPELRINIQEQDKSKVMEHINLKFKKLKKSREDGLRLHFKKGSWALIRPSNTEAVVSVRFQAKNKTELKLIQNLVLKELKKFEK